MARSKVTLYGASEMSLRRGAYVALPLYRRDAEGNYHEATRREVIDNALFLSYRAGFEGRSLNTPAMTREFLQVRLASLDYEMFAVLLLDNRHRLIEYRELFRGTIDGASVHPREVLRDAMAANAAAVIFAHNHPSGVAEPSQADELITRRLRDALAVVDIRVLDHILVAGPTMLSFAERGLL